MSFSITHSGECEHEIAKGPYRRRGPLCPNCQVSRSLPDRRMSIKDTLRITAVLRPSKEKLSSPIRDYEFSVRTENCLLLAGIETLGDLVSHTSKELLELPLFRKKCLYEIWSVLEVHQLTLGMNLTYTHR